MRARLLADRSGAAGSGTDLDSFIVDPDQIAEPAVSDEEYLGAAGLDATAIAAAPTSSKRRRPKRDIVLSAIDILDEPTRDMIVEYTAEYDVSQDYTERLLDRFVEAGAVTVSDGRYRVL